jgi:hypothetical protein
VFNYLLAIAELLGSWMWSGFCSEEMCGGMNISTILVSKVSKISGPSLFCRFDYMALMISQAETNFIASSIAPSL